MSILCYVKLYEGQHPFNNGIHLKPKSDRLVCWKIQECEWKLHRDPLVNFEASHGPTGALGRTVYRGKPVFNALDFIRYYEEVTGVKL